MPSLRRSARPGTTAVIREDLHAARETGGLARATADHLRGTLGLLGITEAVDHEEALESARAILATYVRRACEAVVADSADVCAVAAAKSLAVSLLRQEDTVQKVATIRRAALAATGCQLTLDGLRKREDGLIVQAATATHADLIERQQQRGIRTVEEAVRHSGPLIETVHEELHDGLPLLYSIAPSADERMRRGFIWQALLGVAAALEHLRQILELHVRPGTANSIDFLFADIAQHAFLVTFPDGNDKTIAHDVLSGLDRWTVESFISAIKAHPEGDAFLDRWGVWLSSCHPTCAYQRADVVRLCCRPHQLTTALHEFTVNYRLLKDGDLEAFLDEDLRTWSVRT